MSGFTPGPWLLDGSTVYAIDPEARVNRFSVMANAGHVGRERTSDAELLANARLIAAAPDLLAALTKCLALIDDMSRFVGQMSLQDYALFNEAPMDARKALSSASPSLAGGGE